MDQKSDSSDQHSEAAWQHRAEMALASVIAADRLITYAELADAATIPPPHRIHKLTLWLETKLVVDHRAGAKAAHGTGDLAQPWWFASSGLFHQMPRTGAL